MDFTMFYIGWKTQGKTVFDTVSNFGLNTINWFSSRLDNPGISLDLVLLAS